MNTGSIKCKEFGLAEQLSASQEGLCSMLILLYERISDSSQPEGYEA
jgi:hypothetical protein